jgi:hypothetical protein
VSVFWRLPGTAKKYRQQIPQFVIETDRPTKRFGDVPAVNRVDLRVKQGEIHGGKNNHHILLVAQRRLERVMHFQRT